MSRIEPHIVKHEIKTYIDAKPIWQCLCAMNPRKAPAIKVEVKKLLKARFIYTVPLTEWVPNYILVEKK